MAMLTVFCELHPSSLPFHQAADGALSHHKQLQSQLKLLVGHMTQDFLGMLYLLRRHTECGSRTGKEAKPLARKRGRTECDGIFTPVFKEIKISLKCLKSMFCSLLVKA